jgi:hypothetical protein
VKGSVAGLEAGVGRRWTELAVEVVEGRSTRQTDQKEMILGRRRRERDRVGVVGQVWTEDRVLGGYVVGKELTRRSRLRRTGRNASGHPKTSSLQTTTPFIRSNVGQAAGVLTSVHEDPPSWSTTACARSPAVSQPTVGLAFDIEQQRLQQWDRRTGRRGRVL